MNNFIIVGILVVVVGVIGYLLLTGGAPATDGAPGGNQIIRLLLDTGRLLPKHIEVRAQWPVIFTINNIGTSQHELVIMQLDGEGNEVKEIRRFAVEPGDELSHLRVKLEPGEYLLYCTVKKQGEGTSHRDEGEVAKIIVD